MKEDLTVCPMDSSSSASSSSSLSSSSSAAAAEEEASGFASTSSPSLPTETYEEFAVTVPGELSAASAREGCCKGVASRCRGTCRHLKEPLQELSLQGEQWLKKSFTFKTLKETFPILSWLPKYRLKHLEGDFIAGLTVGLTVIPQGLAYAQIAELSPQYGLYSAFMGCLIYILFGTSKDITLGPTAIMSLLTAEFGRSPIERDATYAIILSLFSGIIQLTMGILHIGFVVDYISHPVINSFTTAAAITIAWGQVKKWLGLKKIPRDFIYEVYWNFRKLSETRLWDYLMGLACLLSLYGMKKLREVKWGNPERMSLFKRSVKYIVWLSTTSRNAIIVIVTSGVSAIFLEYRLKPFSLTGTITGGLPPFRVPDFSVTIGNTTQTATEIFGNIGAGFIILPILGLVETVAIGKAFARKYNYDIDANQELLAIGASNVLGAFVGAYPVTGSFSRTAVNAQSGVMTPASGIWTAVLVLLALAFLTPLFYYIPDAALAAVIIMAVVDMIDFSLLRKLWRIKKVDLIPWLATFICSLLLGVEWGIVIGVAVSLLLLLYPWSRPQFHINFEAHDEAIVMTLNQGLVFPGIERFKDKIYAKALSGGNNKSVVIDFSYIANTDFTAVEALHQLLEDFAKKNRKLIVCNLRPDILNVFERARLKHFEHADTVDDAIAIIKGEPRYHRVESDATTIVSEIQHSASYNDEGCQTDDDDETLEKNYIVTMF